MNYNDEEHDGNASVQERRDASIQNRKFPEKILKYLWDDAFKFSREDVFETGQYVSLEAIVRKFRSETKNARFNVFKEEIRAALFSSDEN